MVRFRPLNFYLVGLTLALGGCWVLPLPHTDEVVARSAKLESLIGAEKTAVIEEIGPPTYTITVSDTDYLIYEGRLTTIGVLFLVWVPIFALPDPEGYWDCLQLEFKDGILRAYDAKLRQAFYNGIDDCRQVFRSAEEPKHIVPLFGAPIAQVHNTFGGRGFVVKDKETIYLVYRYTHFFGSCVLMDFGVDDSLIRHEVKSSAVNCIWTFWTQEQLEGMSSTPLGRYLPTDLEHVLRPIVEVSVDRPLELE